MTRAAPLADADYDVVIIGGGIAGAGAARDLALRGVSVALLDKGDFGSGTTSKSSKLVHGGLRYLELFDFALVRESLRERETLGRLAPHLVKSLPFLVPIYRESSRSLIKVRLGLRLYDWLTPGGDRERYRVLKPVDALSLEPALRARDLRGAGYYFDGLLLYPERLCLENVLSASRHGARVYNYADVEEVVRDARGTLTGVKVRDLLTGQVVTLGARVIVNATGPWVDQIRERARVTERGRRIVRTTKGIHCLLPRLTERAVYHATGDDRMIFVIPWRGFSLVGTTDTDFDGDLDRLQATRAEVDYLLAEARKAIPDPRVDHRHEADVLPQPGRPAGRPRPRHARPARAKPHGGAHARRRRRSRRTHGSPRLARRLARDGHDGPLPGHAGNPGDDVRPRVSPRHRDGRQGGRGRRASLSREPRHRGPAPSRRAGRVGRVAPGRAAPADRHRHQRVSGPRLRREHRGSDGRAPRLAPAAA